MTLQHREGHARDCVAKLRVVYASKVDDPWFNELIQLLCARSPEFGRRRRDHDIELSKNRAGRPPASHS